MGKNDAPKAPSGWYPIEEGKPGERYWDGQAWTGETQGLPKVDKSATTSGLKLGFFGQYRKPILISVSILLSAVLLFLFFLNAQTDMSSTKIESAALDAKTASPELKNGVAVPDLTGLTKSDAQLQLESLGFQVAIDTSLFTASGEPGTVMKMIPRIGTLLEKGSKVTLMVVPDLTAPIDPNSDSNQANSAWYPTGFYEYNNQLAYQWVEGGADPCGSVACQFNTMNVIAKTGCPRGVYVEVNFLSGGVVVDWSNDTVPSLSAGQTAQLQFVSYQGNVDSAQVANMSCN